MNTSLRRDCDSFFPEEKILLDNFMKHKKKKFREPELADEASAQK